MIKKQLSSATMMHWISIVVGLCVSLLALSPASVSADACTDQGEWTATDGNCCPSSQIVISSNTVTCPTAQDPCNGNISNTQALTCVFKKYVNPVIALLSAAVGIIVVITIVRGALMYTTSSGDPSKAAAGKQHIINALIGLVAYLALYVFLQFMIPGGLLN